MLNLKKEHLMKTALIAGVIFAAVSLNVAAEEVIVEAGMGFSQAPAVRVGLSFPVKSWLNVETGVLGTAGGAIVDVTPMFHYGSKLYGEAGIGISYASAANLDGRQQSTQLNFRDVACVGYVINPKWRTAVCVEHYSNGGSLNPLFGSSNNEGYTWGMLRVGRSF
jgi:hypothetical protein